jgi:hypothetical protein
MVDKLLYKMLKEHKPPYNIVVDVIEMPDHIALRVYENEIMAFSEDKRIMIMEYLIKLREVVHKFGMKCDFQGRPGDPPRSI